VWLGGTHIALVRTLPVLLLLVWGGGVGGLGTLLGPEETPACRVFLVAILGLAGLTHWGFCGVVVGVGFGVWLCVECCIVDASILLWSSV
jgi:hypothetical protein